MTYLFPQWATSTGASVCTSVGKTCFFGSFYVSEQFMTVQQLMALLPIARAGIMRGASDHLANPVSGNRLVAAVE